MHDLAESATAVCCNPVCSKRFALGRCQNQHRRAGSRRKVAAIAATHVGKRHTENGSPSVTTSRRVPIPKQP
jgi:hypothetical protein